MAWPTHIIEAVPLDGGEYGPTGRVPADHVQVVVEHDCGGLAASAPHGRQRPPPPRRRVVHEQVARVPPRVRATAHHVYQT